MVVTLLGGHPVFEYGSMWEDAPVLERLSALSDTEQDVHDAATLHICYHCRSTRVEGTLFEPLSDAGKHWRVLRHCPDCPEGLEFSIRLYTHESICAFYRRLRRPVSQTQEQSVPTLY